MSAALFKRKFYELHDRYGEINPPTIEETPTEGQQAMFELFESSRLSDEKIGEIMGWSEKEKPTRPSPCPTFPRPRHDPKIEEHHGRIVKTTGAPPCRD
jgi:hypothetical protein